MLYLGNIPFGPQELGEVIAFQKKHLFEVYKALKSLRNCQNERFRSGKVQAPALVCELTFILHWFVS